MTAPLHPAARLRRPAGALLTVLGVAAVLWATLRHGDPATLEALPFTCLVCGSSGGIDVWRNVVLFGPLGAGLGLLGVRPRWAALAGLALSLFVETAQLTVLVGRSASVSDLITNTTGAALGALVVRRWRMLAVPTPSQARRLAGAAGLALVAALALAGLGLRWADAPPYRVNQRPPTEGTMRPFEGVVHEATLDGVPVARGERARPLLPVAPGDTLRLAARVTPAYPPGKLRPVVWLFTPEWAEVLVFGQRRQSLVVRLRTASADARFASPTFLLRDVFPAGQRPIEIRAEATRDGVRLWSAGPGGEREARFTKRLALGWALLAPVGTEPLFPRLAAAAWLALLVLPLAYWGAQARGPGRRTAALAIVAVVAAGSAALLSAAFGLAPPTSGDWAGLLGGVAAGGALAAAAARLDRARDAAVARRAA